MPTTNPVPSTDPTDLLFNAQKLDEVVNGTANSFTDRMGVARRTVAGMNADFDAQLADAESDLNVYRADAAASASEALGYLQTIRATSYGAYAEDPATDPLGNPPTVGDEYFNTTANLLKRWNGATWQASDINTANLAASSGSSLVGYDGGTVQDVLDAVTGPTGAAYVGFQPAGTGAVSTTLQDRLRKEVLATDYMTEGSSDISDGIKKALSANAGRAITVKVPRRTDQFYWDWSQEIDLASFDSWVSVVADGFVPCKASAALSSFIVIGKSNKSNAGFVSGFSFNAGNYNHGCAVKIGASRSFTVQNIELKADGTGKYTDGIVFDESVNTSGEQGSGFELNVVDNIIDSGDSSVTGSMVRFKYGSARGVTVNNIRATRDSFTHVVSNDAGIAVIGGQISNIQATFISQRVTPCDALVKLSGAVDAIDIHNIYTLDGTANASCNYAVKITSSGGTPKRIYLGNCSALVTTNQYSVDANAATVFTNFRTKNAGKPDEAGAMFANAAIRPQGALVWDTVNKVLWTENDGVFEAAFDQRFSVINNDSVLSINVGTTDNRTYGGLISIAVEGQPTYSGIVFWRTAVSSVCSQITASANLNTTTGVLTGTTGAASKVTVSADVASGKIYIENRTGAGRRFHVSFI